MATSHDRYLCKSFSRYDKLGKTLSAGAPWTRLRWETSRRRRIAQDGGVILAQDGSWRFFDRGGDGGDAGCVLPDRTVGDRGRLARQGFLVSGG